MSKNHYVSGDWNITKCCSVCKEEKSLDNFYKQVDGKCGVASRCKPCLLEANKKHMKPEKQKEYTENWRNKANNRELSRQSTRTWRRNNLPYDAFRAATYRAEKAKRTPSWSDLPKIKALYLGCPIGFHVDHVIPLRGKLVSGLHVENNLQYLPAQHNLSKRNIYHV
jgi:hypothetical protein